MGREPDAAVRAEPGMHRLRLAPPGPSPAEPVPLDPVLPDPVLPDPVLPAAVPLAVEVPSDGDLIQAGETAEEFARLFDRYSVTIHRYVARRLGTTEAD